MAWPNLVKWTFPAISTTPGRGRELASEECHDSKYPGCKKLCRCQEYEPETAMELRVAIKASGSLDVVRTWD